MITRLKSLREDHDLTQKQISEYLNVSQVAYSYYELNKRSIPIEILDKLASYYNTSIDYIVWRTNVVTPYPQKVKAFSDTSEQAIEYAKL